MRFQNLLLIDDDEDDQEIFITAVTTVSTKAECVAMFDARHALERLLRRELEPDVIFLDLNMPIMNGQQFLTEVKKVPSLNHIPVIIFSTSSNPRTIESVKALGAHDFITKPGLFDELITILKPMLV